MGLSDTWMVPTGSHYELVHETHASQFAHLFAIQRRLKVELELIEGLDPGKRRQFEAGLDIALETPLPFGLQGLYQKVL